jgi:hypothetical protein
MRSNEPIDRQTRDAIADALERTEGVRLELKKGNEASWTKRAETRLRWQGIADDFKARLREPDAIEKNIRTDVAKDWKVSVRTVDDALAWARRTSIRLTYTPHGERSET